MSLASEIGDLAAAGAEVEEGVERSPEPGEGMADDEGGEEDTAEAPASQAELDPCSVPPIHDQHWLDTLHDRLWWSVCGTARWFDGFFGKERNDDQLASIHGRAAVDVLWDDYDGWDLRGRLRVKIPLPNLDNRVDAFFGRDDDDVITDRDRGLDLIPGPFRETRDEEWLVGFGYRPARARRDSDLDFKVGVKFHFPLEPFVRARYWHRWFPSERSLFRFQETLFWRSNLGFGATSSLSYERFMGRSLLLRWRGTATVAEEEVDGWEWSSLLTLYQGVDKDVALAYRAIVRGETKDPETLEEYGGSVTYRRRAFREWFFFEIVVGVTWPRELLTETREASPQVGFGFEIEFGRAERSRRLDPHDPPDSLREEGPPKSGSATGGGGLDLEHPGPGRS